MDTVYIKENQITVIDERKDLTKTSQSVKRDFAKYLSKEEIQNRIQNIKPGQNRMLIQFLWMSGVRITEAVSLKKKDINFEDKIMTVRWQKSKKYQNRNVPIHTILNEALRYYTANMNMEDLVFPISRQRAHQITTKYIGVNPHCLRHSFSVNWLRCEGDFIILHRILGHSKVQTTMEYLKIIPIDQAKELEKISF